MTVNIRGRNNHSEFQNLLSHSLPVPNGSRMTEMGWYIDNSSRYYIIAYLISHGKWPGTSFRVIYFEYQSELQGVPRIGSSNTNHHIEDPINLIESLKTKEIPKEFQQKSRLLEILQWVYPKSTELTFHFLVFKPSWQDDPIWPAICFNWIGMVKHHPHPKTKNMYPSIRYIDMYIIIYIQEFIKYIYIYNTYKIFSKSPPGDGWFNHQLRYKKTICSHGTHTLISGVQTPGQMVNHHLS